MSEAPLSGRCIAVPEARELDVFAAMLERRGATTLRCPLVSIRDAPDPEPVLAWLRDFARGSCDDLILFTGEGLNRLLACIERHEPALREPFVAALAAVRKIVRGPKPARALRALKLKPDLEAREPTTAGVIATLSSLELRGRRVGVQLYGIDPNETLMRFLNSVGAQALPVAPYIYADAAANQAIEDLLQRIAADDVDAIAFTSASQLQRLVDVAGRARIQAVLGRTLIAAVGPIVAAALRAEGLDVAVVPDSQFFMKPMVSLLEKRLATTR